MERNERQSQKKNIRQKNYAQLFTPPELTSSRAGKQVGRKQTLIKHIYNRMNYFWELWHQSHNHGNGWRKIHIFGG